TCSRIHPRSSCRPCAPFFKSILPPSEMKAAEKSPNVALRLGHWAAVSPQRTAVIAGRDSLSFLALDEGCARLGAGLEAIGVKRGMRVALLVPPGVDFFALTF